MTTPRAGELNRRIDLQAPSRTPDGQGGFAVSWVTVISTVSAAIWPVKAIENQGAHPGAVVTHRIRIRYREGVKSHWRILHKGKYFNIVSIINPGTEYRALDLMAREVV